MNDEAESSRAPQRPDDALPELADLEEAIARLEEEEQREKEKYAKQTRLDAKRKRIQMLGELLRDLDMVVYLELITLYHLDCSFFWLVFKIFIHGTLLTPLPDTAAATRPPDEPKPFLPLLLFSFGISFLSHLTYPRPSAGEDTRGYLHGGLMIDFIGQQGPTSKWKLGALDICILILQLVMVSVHVKRRELKKKLAKLSAGETPSSASDRATSDPPPAETAAAAANDNAARGQDVDDEERGVLHRTDTMSDIGLDPDDEQDALVPTSDSGHTDAIDILTSGQCVIGHFTVFDTLLQENRNYSAYRLTRTESGMNDMPETLRRLNTLRTRFGVGGG
ncbi:DSC E3 ubiquitin ligase complex subunit 4 [Pyrenophora seminiperda CCB06]|uniref:DSC E3 ubiquitin ligase complex subunit 4 n=1 Tax=Pyrenophora seminiperda CCB06 TaxID=1302712 RepID=A0A3M7MCT0_9PLEO|nr:DSC E3 ubiquitin ligase complex subunit 4 [Pyrenophora seminiperda CCB06]